MVEAMRAQFFLTEASKPERQKRSLYAGGRTLITVPFHPMTDIDRLAGRGAMLHDVGLRCYMSGDGYDIAPKAARPKRLAANPV
jgi:hypothetical protein